MTKERLYIYAIIENIGGAPSNDIWGLNNQKIIFIPHRALSVVASSISFQSKADPPMAENNFDNLGTEELSSLVLIHEKVNEALIRNYNVIPLKFGTIVEDKEQLFSFLEKTYPRFLAALEKIDNKAEFIVETLWDEKKILEEIARENPEIQKLKQKAESRGRILGLPIKIKLGKLIFENLELRRKEYVEDILNFLKNFAADYREGKFFQPKADTLLAENKKAIMSYSFLIEKSQESEFESKLNQLAEKYQNKLGFKYIGPMAPYSFANIAFALADNALIENARKTLGVSEKMTLPQIKTAYHSLANQYHPDKHGESKETEEQMREIIKAYKTLEKVHDKSILEI